jgi:hypothetical protein
MSHKDFIKKDNLYKEISRGIAEGIEIQEDKFRPDMEKLKRSIEKLKIEHAELEIITKKLCDYLGKEHEPEIDPVFHEGMAKGMPKASETLFENVKALRKYRDKLQGEAKEHLLNKAGEVHCIHEKVPTDNFGLLIGVAKQISNQHNIDVTLISDEPILGYANAVCVSRDGIAQREIESISKEDVQGDEQFCRTTKVNPFATTSYFGPDKAEKQIFFHKFLKEFERQNDTE